MNLGLDMNLQEELSEGVIHLSPDGQVTDFNRAAVPWVQYAMAAKNQLHLQMAQISNGMLRPPLPIELPGTEDAVLHNHTVYLCTAGPAGYALFITNRRASAQAATLAANDNDFFRLLGAQTRHELTHLLNTLSDASNEATASGGSLPGQAHRLSRLLVAFDQLSRLHQTDAFQSGERLSLWRLVEKLVDETKRGPCCFYINPQLESKVESDSVIYGDAIWLETSIRTLMAAVAELAPAHSKVEMRVRLHGSYVVLSSHFSNASIKEVQSCKESNPAVTQELRFDSDIAWQICRRVIEMHGGSLTVTERDCAIDGEAGIESFVATFALSAPSHAGSSVACASCPMALQMDKYAKDIAFLLSRQTVHGQTSRQEIQMLTKLLSPSLSASTDASGDRADL